MSTPLTLVGAKIGKFRKFLSTHGAEVLETTNEWEVLRCRVRGETAVLYRNKYGHLTWPELLEEAYIAWRKGDKWSGLNGNRVKNRVSGKKRTVVMKTLAERDGDECWFCGKANWTEEEPTVEHLLEIAKGGGNHVFNLVLACDPCNKSVQDLSIAQKVAFREKKRGLTNGST